MRINQDYQIEMSAEEARAVKLWRLNGASWRTIADKVAERWPESDIGLGQETGAMLCDAASLTLGEWANGEEWN